METTKEIQTLKIKNLHVEVEGKEILHGITLDFESGNVHAIMGPNGSGKSTLANAIMGHPKYKITKGKILFNGQDITNYSVKERADLGLFLSFQYPAEVAGVTISNFLREAINTKREREGQEKLSVIDSYKLLKEKMELLDMDPKFRTRDLNSGFSGGEKKRSEMLQLLLLKPVFAILDETDSGLDVDGIKAVAKAIHIARKDSPMGIILITHYEHFMRELSPDKVTVLCNGKIIQQGSKELAKKIQEKGFNQFVNEQSNN
ncbi:Fe-S cluster assembly ATPase SufC [archaeon]|nr:Fe-S cluster assembly ATPase SufC [archaeon]|tara:strand:- start:732 stop:1514 length:783 start_codon:yes stop_codon:yes gene_type:complete